MEVMVAGAGITGMDQAGAGDLATTIGILHTTDMAVAGITGMEMAIMVTAMEITTTTDIIATEDVAIMQILVEEIVITEAIQQSEEAEPITTPQEEAPAPLIQQEM